MSFLLLTLQEPAQRVESRPTLYDELQHISRFSLPTTKPLLLFFPLSHIAIISTVSTCSRNGNCSSICYVIAITLFQTLCLFIPKDLYHKASLDSKSYFLLIVETGDSHLVIIHALLVASREAH